MDIQRSPEFLKAKKIRRWIYVGVAALLLAGVTLGVSRLKPAAPSVDKSTVWTGDVQRGLMVREVRGLGTLVPVEIDWVPALTEGRVVKRFLLPGAVVKPTTVILQLSNPQLEQQLINAQYQLKSAEAALGQLKATVQNGLMALQGTAASVRSNYRTTEMQAEADAVGYKEGVTPKIIADKSSVAAAQLKDQDSIAQEQVKTYAESMKSQLAVGEATVAQDRAQVALYQREVDDLMVRAGIDGVLQLLPVEVGQSVTPGTNLARVADPKHLKAEIKIAETQAKDVAIGQKASIDTRNGIVPGHVVRIDPSVVNGTVTVDVYMDGPLPEGARPDLSVDGTITLEKLNDVLYVGRPVHGDADSTISLFKLVDDGSEAERVTVKLGRTSVNTVEILQGLQVGDKVILSDMSAWDNYDRIRLK